MEKIIIRYKDKSFKINLSRNNTCIFDSYVVKNISDMKNILKEIKKEANDKLLAINKRSSFSMINEWRVHNLLYSLNIQRDRTRSVDLNMGHPWYINILYTIISPFYFHFN